MGNGIEMSSGVGVASKREDIQETRRKKQREEKTESTYQ